MLICIGVNTEGHS